jgi:hypothetical protein
MAQNRAQVQEIKSPDRESVGDVAHVRNFLDCVKTRNKPNADAKTGCRSTIPCLLAAMAVRTGKAYSFDWMAKQARTV